MDLNPNNLPACGRALADLLSEAQREGILLNSRMDEVTEKLQSGAFQHIALIERRVDPVLDERNVPQEFSTWARSRG